MTKKNTSKQSLVTAIVLVVLAGIITTKIQNASFTKFFFASSAPACDNICKTDRQCASGTTCQYRAGTTGPKICKCINGNCIKKFCKDSMAMATLGMTCDPGVTDDDRKGNHVSAPIKACKIGLQCRFIRRLAGSSYNCCDPKNLASDPDCIEDPLLQVGPLP